jgi:hypothetical protein
VCQWQQQCFAEPASLSHACASPTGAFFTNKKRNGRPKMKAYIASMVVVTQNSEWNEGDSKQQMQRTVSTKDEEKDPRN